MVRLKVIDGGKTPLTEPPRPLREGDRRLFRRDEIYMELPKFLPSADQARARLAQMAEEDGAQDMLDDLQAIEAIMGAWVGLASPFLELLSRNPDMVLRALPYYIEHDDPWDGEGGGGPSLSLV